jgi:hypothetical protein
MVVQQFGLHIHKNGEKMSSSSSSEIKKKIKTVLCLAYTGDYLFAGTGEHGILLRSSSGNQWDNFYRVDDKNITALYFYNNSLYIGTAPHGKIYIADINKNVVSLSQKFNGSIIGFASLNNEVYMANNPYGIYKFNILTAKWDFFYKPAASYIYDISVANNKLVVVTNKPEVITCDGKNMNLINIA